MKILKNTCSFPILVMLIICLLPFSVFSQKTKPENGKVEIIQDPNVDVLLSKHIQINQNQDGIDGFRVQIFFDSGNNAKNQAIAVQGEFMSRYPETTAYLTFKSPNYRVRVGDFRTRLDAQRFLNIIATDYPNAFITDEKIQLPRD